MLCWTRLWLLPGQHIAGLTDQSGSGCCSLWNSTGLGGVACIVHATHPYLDIIPDKYTFGPSPCWDLSGHGGWTTRQYRDFLQFFHMLCGASFGILWQNSELFWTSGLKFWPRMQGKVPTIFRHMPILELSGGHVELGDNTCLVHFCQSRELRFS